ncbi:scsC, partial [Symbiodinium sp. KB8]
MGALAMGSRSLASRQSPLSAVSAAAQSLGGVRFLNLHEYQSKEVMEKFNVVVQKGDVADSAEKARKVAEWIKNDNNQAELIVKSQIHAGGRGKGVFDTGFKGGVQIVADYASKMLGHKLVTKQTGSEGQLVSKVLINEGITIERELYFAILMDRAFHGPVIVASTQGGMDIEEVAETNPDAIVKVGVDILEGLTDAQAEELAKKLQFEGKQVELAKKQFKSLYNLFIGTDATQVEINPLAVGSIPGGEQGLGEAPLLPLPQQEGSPHLPLPLLLICSLWLLQKEIFSMRDRSMEDPRDVRAEEAGLNYIGLDGNIGCMVNGAGLAM